MRKRPEVSPEESSGRRNRAGYHGPPPRLPTPWCASVRRPGSRPRAHSPPPRVGPAAASAAAPARFVTRRGRSLRRLRDPRGPACRAARGERRARRVPRGTAGRRSDLVSRVSRGLAEDRRISARSPDPRFGPGRRPAPAGAGRRFRFRSAGGRGSAAATERVATGRPGPRRDPGGWVRGTGSGGRDPGDGIRGRGVLRRAGGGGPVLLRGSPRTGPPGWRRASAR